MRFRKRLLCRHLSVRPRQSPMRISSRRCISQAGEIFDFSNSACDPGKRRSQQVFES